MLAFAILVSAYGIELYYDLTYEEGEFVKYLIRCYSYGPLAVRISLL